MFKLLKKLFSREEPKQEVVVAQPKTNPMVKEPILTFVKVFKDNPRRFRVREVGGFQPQYKEHREVRFKVFDKKLQNSFELQCLSGKPYQVFNLDFDLNFYELRYLWDELYPVACKTVERYRSIRDIKVQRKMRAAEEAQQTARNKWLEVYSE